MYRSRKSKKSTAGFTLVELLVVIIMAGVLAAIAAPSWLAFMNRQRVNAAQDQAFQALRRAQANAIREKRTWEVSFQEKDDRLQWSTHLASDGAVVAWQDLPEGNADRIKIDPSNSDLKPTGDPCQAGDYCVKFQDRGIVAEDVAGQKITFTTVDDDDGPKRCVYVATILGSLRTDRDEGCQ
ncbi:MAG TPA: type II secretion system protein [Oscillatoriales cyanobacterium M59_W2019_021]|nr:type II secretion system protein [Oscillatoriales cyanobacterium M4454_W2019_049]HIK53368.1 type II secretion system protein [Oscillatoriales cyanobacterium M59_W2019_021]